MPMGRDMDGSVLTEAVTPEFLERHPLTHIDSYDTDMEFHDVEDDDPVSEVVMARLRDLGYVE